MNHQHQYRGNGHHHHHQQDHQQQHNNYAAHEAHPVPVDRRVFRGAFSPDQEFPEAFKQGVPTFDTIPECMAWANQHAVNGSNPYDPNLKHNITHLVGWNQIQSELIPRIKDLHQKENLTKV
jgi:hypothetical protein